MSGHAVVAPPAVGEARAPASIPDVAGAQLVVRAISLILHLRDSGRPLSATALSDALGIAPSSTYRLLQTLELSGFVERRGRGEFALGLRLLDLGRAVRGRVDEELAPALAVMKAITAETGESSLLTMRAGMTVVGVLTVDSPRPVRLTLSADHAGPLTRGASGKVFLPWVPARILDAAIAREEALADGPTGAELRETIEQIRRDGYCVTVSELDPGTVGVAAPILAAPNRLLGALTVAGPAMRIPAKRVPRLADQVRAAAADIASRLAHAPSYRA
jgi:DNA-binding IclR family transcriptional regulator